MSKGLEALEIVKTAMLSSGNCLLNSLWDYTDVIEKELKSLDNMRLLLLSYEVEGNEKFEKALKEYEQYKEIEQRHGIDLVTLFKAFTQGIWVKSDGWDCSLEYEPKFIPPEQLELGRETYYEYGVGDKRFTLIYKEENALCFYTHNYEDTENVVRIKEYGKMYALTKEELK